MKENRWTATFGYKGAIKKVDCRFGILPHSSSGGVPDITGTEVKNMNAEIRQQAYALQHEATVLDMQTFVRGNKRSVSLPIKAEFVSTGIIEWSKDYVMTQFTRSDLYAGLTIAYENARKHGPQACGSLPSKPNKTGHINALGMGYTPTPRGKNAGKPKRRVSLVLQGLAATRQANGRAAYKADLEASVKAGTAFTAEGVVDKDGASRSYPDEHSARKAWVRQDANYGANWWDCDKAVKAERLAEAVVTQL